MRALVVTMYSGENEFPECVEAIERQSFRSFEHHIIEGEEYKAAHEACFGSFLSRRDDFDVMIKVDADMVIRSASLFADIVGWFRRDQQMQLLSIGVHDFYTNRLVSGLNSYRNTIGWMPTGEAVFSDHVPVALRHQVFDYRRLAPAAAHCPDSSRFHAFHFGIHRGVKALECVERGRFDGLYRRCQDLALTWRQFGRRREIRLALAALGGELALRGLFGQDDLSYASPHAREVFEEYEDRDVDDIERVVRELRRSNGGRLPWRLRMELMRRDVWSLPLRLLVPEPLRMASRYVLARTTGLGRGR